MDPIGTMDSHANHLFIGLARFLRSVFPTFSHFSVGIKGPGTAPAAAKLGSRVGGSSKVGQQGQAYDYWRDTPSAGMTTQVLKTWGNAVYLKGLSKKRR